MSARGRLLALLGTAFFMTILDGTSLLTALPSIERDLGLHGAEVQWTVTAYAVAFSGPLLLCGRAADLLGRRRMFLVGMVLRVLASLACGLAPSAGVLVAARALQGVSAAIIAPAALSMVTNAFPEGAERNRALGVWGGIGGVGATAGLLLGGLVTELLGWQWVFWINLPIGCAVLALATAVLPESRGPACDRPFDVAGAVTVTLAMTLVVYGITGAPSAGLSRTVGALATGAALVLLFVRIERRSTAPLVPFRVLRSNPLIGGNLLVLTAGMTVDGMLITLTTYAQRELGWPALRFGLVAAVMTLTALVGGLLGQRLATRRGVRRVAVGGAASLAAACAILSQAGGETVLIVVALVVFGAGMGAAAVSGQISALSRVAERHSGLTAALVDTSFAVGTALGVAVCGTLATVAPPPYAFGAAGVFACLGLAAALALLARRTALRTTDRPRETVTHG